MTAHPEMVSGERRSDLALMRAGRGDWVAKIGAEGVQGIGLRGAGIGIAIKVVGRQQARAAARRGGGPRRSSQLLDARSRAELAAWFEPAMHNYRGIVTGRIVSSVVLDNVASCMIPLPRIRNNPTRAMNFPLASWSVAASAHRGAFRTRQRSGSGALEV